MSVAERIQLARRLNRLHYAEYHRVCWLKAAAIKDLYKQIAGILHPLENVSPAQASGQTWRLRFHLATLDTFRRGDLTDLEGQRDLIRLFLLEHLMYQVPESIGAWDLPPEEFEPINRPEMLLLVDEMIETSLANPEAQIGTQPSGASSTAVDGVDELSYERIRTWFVNELFDPTAVAYFVHSLGEEGMAPEDSRQPTVVGMDRDVVAMLWLEL